MKLTIELVPQTSWYTNVRSEVSKEEWDKIRRKCYQQAKYKCEICGGKGDKWPVECHEIWHYDDQHKRQILTGLIALCPNCHKTKHVGLSQMNGELDLVIQQLMKVNGLNKKEALDYINESFQIWNERSRFDWDCNIDYLKEYCSGF